MSVTPDLGARRDCAVCGGRGMQVFVEMGRRSMPQLLDRAEASRESRYKVWQCERNPIHITRPEDRLTPIQPCKQCGGLMFHTMRLYSGRSVPVDPRSHRARSVQAVEEPLSGWRCFEDPSHVVKD